MAGRVVIAPAASLVLIALFVGGGAGCKRRTEPGTRSEQTAQESGPTRSASPAPSPGPRTTQPPPAEIWKEFSGENAFAEVKKQVAIGPRPAGSPEIERARMEIIDTLGKHGWDTEEQAFTEQTPRGAVKFVNILARFSATTARPAPADMQRAIVCSHYDSKRFSTIQFVGANDGASSTGALLELARVLALNPKLAAQVELVFFDGEEAFAQFTETDGLYGSRYYARALRESRRAVQFRFGILWDMIGDKDLTITLSPDSPQPLTEELLKASDVLGLRAHFTYHDRPIWDDHVPLNQARIPTVNLIDFDYLYWHTADDTLDKLSAESLQKIGALTLYYLRAALAP